MPRTRNPYPAEFREQIVALARPGAAPRIWRESLSPARRRSMAGSNRLNVLAVVVMTSEERDELRRLRRENRQLRQERDILAKAGAWFAQSDVTSSRSSN